MTAACDADRLYALACGFAYGEFANGSRFQRAYRDMCLRGALRIIVANGSRKVRAEAKELLRAL
jgi:hypothetical protein